VAPIAIPAPVAAVVVKVAALEITRPRLYAALLVTAGVILVYYGLCGPGEVLERPGAAQLAD
jgi:hypothetical protein